MDDSDDKARRNLVAASAGVLFCSIAGIPLPSIAGRLLLGLSAGEQYAQLAPTRVWLAVAMALLYFGLRFRFSAATGEAYRSMRLEWQGIVRALVENRIRSAARVFTRTGRESPIFGGSLAPIVLEKVEGMKQSRASVSGSTFPALGRPEVTLTRMATAIETDVYGGSLSIACAWPDQEAATHGGMSPSYRIEGIRQLLVRAQAATWLVVYSRAAMQIVVPSGLGIIAFATASWQLVASIHHH
jgi:hypothetical protein